MAEAVAVIGLVASIVNIVDFAAKIVSRLKAYSSTASALPAAFQSVADQLPLLVRVLNRIRSRIESATLSKEDASALLPVLSNASDDVKSLYEILEAAWPQTEASSMERATKALISLSLEKETVKVLHRVHSNIQLLVFAQTLDHADLKDKVVELLSDISLSRTSTPNPPPLMPYNQGLILGAAPQIQEDYLVGRMTELSRLREWLNPDSETPAQKIVSIVGMGGLGKTQLSLAYAKRHSSLYSAIFWLNAKDEPSLNRSLTQAHSAISKSKHPDLIATDEKINVFRQWLSEAENSRWLLIFDNYDNPKQAAGAPTATPVVFDIRDYFPHRTHGNILITTRSTRLIFSKQLKLRILTDPEQSLDILTSRSGRDIRKGRLTSFTPLTFR
jgi:hypothetical protein